jgi:hypothetical protein
MARRSFLQHFGQDPDDLPPLEPTQTPTLWNLPCA